MIAAPTRSAAEPDRNCDLCPRLADFRLEWKIKQPDWFCAPVPTFGSRNARLLIVGLAPGLRGANRTGRPFTGDFAGDLLYATLVDFGFGRGNYEAHAEDGFALIDAAITNAVRCVPPGNKPTGEEVRTCGQFLIATIKAMPNLRAILALGRIAHESVVRLQRMPQKEVKFAHGATHDLPGGIVLYDSYHCSRYNTNTRRLTADMFAAVFYRIRKDLAST